jgi:hypothetical protein
MAGAEANVALIAATARQLKVNLPKELALSVSAQRLLDAAIALDAAWNGTDRQDRQAEAARQAYRAAMQAAGSKIHAPYRCDCADRRSFDNRAISWGVRALWPACEAPRPSGRA